MAAAMDFQMLQITLVCTVYSCVQRLRGASSARYELLLEKRTQQDQRYYFYCCAVRFEIH
jgi:hypothetical protein